jgi:hypothetical protein
MRSPTTTLACFVLFAIQGLANATVVWSDSFNGQTAGVAPSMDFLGGAAGNDYAVIASGPNANFVVSDVVGNGVPGLTVVDTGTGGTDQATLQVTMNHFAPFVVGPASVTPVMRVRFDIRVDSFLAAANAQNARFIFRANNTNNTGSQMVIAFSYADLNDGDPATGDLALFADTQTGGTSNVPPKNNTAIGLIPGTGWLPGFDFGSFDAGDAAANDTNDEFYRISFDYDSISGAISGSVTQLSSGATAALPAGLSLTPGTTFSNTTAEDRFLLASSVSNTATAYFDNFVFEAVPEPTGAILVTGGLAFVAIQRRRKAALL